ncbi:cytidylyltransferase domain-containing protein [Herbaspirillum sp. SJZ099]|uniref:acylneuraminate cytidylyltransferase family protein n=1 Tax=Herbaspirillum sp. SJZ099 TaxID=2572916 RepID=UPI0011A976A1|nr:acylneuraminate cytidylyltransferase family protein [Herbaspirillum sp. SJZ099]TWC68374.1 N-acylneuraminate cytidylyltransferase/CMP-N,N'-diacetyllegionaminic acid synthase [Herbaspirillum sp. SJZ099]
MINDKKVLALIPARSGSKGLPGKNIRLLHGKPLLTWPIGTARASRYVDRVILSTDSVEFAEVGKKAGAEVPFLRPAELASDTAPSIGFILHAIDALKAAGDCYDYLVLLEPTSPLTEAHDVDSALETLENNRQYADAIVSVAELASTHPAFAVRLDNNKLMSPYVAKSFGQLPRRQDIEPLFSLDGSLYISSIEALRHEHGFCHKRTMSHIMPRYKSHEIDDLVDFVCIEAILSQQDLIKQSQ